LYITLRDEIEKGEEERYGGFRCYTGSPTEKKDEPFDEDFVQIGDGAAGSGMEWVLEKYFLVFSCSIRLSS